MTKNKGVCDYRERPLSCSGVYSNWRHAAIYLDRGPRLYTGKALNRGGNLSPQTLWQGWNKLPEKYGYFILKV